ncbi:hypothetical protein COT70_01120 [candidate division WWE3 bacterium CG09_land_8_20_14_0_10_47_33]|uniref:Uncharacterized protein n=1 Tax=candidate division WWE3 bacterium CG_4_9_14_0_2_um_filter_48_10 TaxID=1975078 RepID=A0A2M8EKF4_UNCKA|nr:MAG: hypothetical protein COT70_01120 [candidate division WWE3 bacterium CG09_land_8_20_14_0_10_47_33]PIZ41076.1 MAG: hypothetical protein COY35_01065 [candidate division WWE3 bacterium CG_4_10_14_0_2_um_filter_47_8]PJC23226.1 MAG: hypothetical protein CO059_00080 [candidate division WWE3 bacterium CG_4_9_14_0_2_um_filter_48_10]PJE52125.1 MAG: hypothetical protein COV28_01045 [candidate division WWE3 bacterium CG10_big_fil_rev_8_21_14_0_10_48_23]
MAYSLTSKKSGRTYYLHGKTVTLKNTGKQQTIYYFAPDIRAGALDAIPAGFKVDENPRTGLPYLRKG